VSTSAKNGAMICAFVLSRENGVYVPKGLSNVTLPLLLTYTLLLETP